MSDSGRSESLSSVSEMKWGKGIRWANAASVEEGRRHKRVDFLTALEVGSVLSVTAAVAVKVRQRRLPGMAIGGRRTGEWARWAASPSGPDTLVASEEMKGVGRLLWRVGREASWAGVENFRRKQVRLQGMFGRRSDRAAKKIENYFCIDSRIFGVQIKTFSNQI
jgi:hypothetical protein